MSHSEEKINGTDAAKTRSQAIEVPSISLPKGGGAIKGIDEKFSVNAVNGTAGFSFPLPISPARGATPGLTLSYNSGSGNGVFGLGWSLSLPSIKRKTDKRLPEYHDAADSDVFLFSGAEDLVPRFKKDATGGFASDVQGNYVLDEKDSADALFTIRYYRPRIEGLFARIERWMAKDGREIKWKVTTRDNVTTLFGWSSESRVADPSDHSRIFEWLPEFVFDDKGNCCHYRYQQEDAVNVDFSALHNKNRLSDGSVTYTNSYLQQVLYGNKTPYRNFGDAYPGENDYLFATVFDYGTPTTGQSPEAVNIWDFRPDAFSDYRAGFEIRTTRLCKRVLLFHHFIGENEYDGLVRSVDFEYDTHTEENFTFLKKIHSIGYIKKEDSTYTQKQLPPMEFTYQQHDWNSTVKSIAPSELIHAPAGITEGPYQFTDLFNEGLSGILSEQGSGWFYKHNLGDGTFEAAKLVSPKPSFSGLDGQLQWADLGADGGKQLVNYTNGTSGYFEWNDDNEWENFRAFSTLPNIDFGDANTRFLDLDGDGKADLLISEENMFTWYPSVGRNGFSQAVRSVKPFDEESGPALVFSEVKQSIFLADMSGSGLMDIVRIRNGEVCYWPNLGYGKFGAKIAMDDTPVFDQPDAFNPAYVRLADIDGSGTTDIIYLGKNKFTCYKNLHGNRFSTMPFACENFPEIHNQATVVVTDLLGSGTACIVWSSPLAKDTAAPLRYIDLTNGKKPHIMVAYKNNMGKEVSLEYTASTRFYIADKLAGRPWATKLHFPVHCVSRTITMDHISGHRFECSYKYHHGYYDHAEREFRGFGMVEQTDAETFEHWVKTGATNITEQSLHQEPVVSKTWFHTGAFLRKDVILGQFEQDYWYNQMEHGGIPVTHHELQLPDAYLRAASGIDPSIIDTLSAIEWQQAIRSCKGMTLRSEVFTRDVSNPYTVSAQNYVIELLQPKGKNQHAVFIVHGNEAITYNYERNIEDPRVAHQLNIKRDEYGHVLESAAVVYPRRLPDAALPARTQQEQNKTVIRYSLHRFTNDVIDADAYRLRLPSEVKIVELKGVAKSGAYYTLLDFADILEDSRSDEAQYHEIDKPLTPGKAQRRLIEHVRTAYSRNDLTGALPLHQLQSLAIPFESYQLAYTPQLVTDIFEAKVEEALLIEGKFTHSESDANWWIRSGTTQCIAGEETAADAASRFYVPVSYTDPYGAVTRVKYGGNYFLFIQETEDALGNKAGVQVFNFRTLSPQRMKDINGNFSEVVSDELGIVKAMAVMGKGNQADDLSGLLEETAPAEQALIQGFFNTSLSTAIHSTGRELIRNATVRFVYDFDSYQTSGSPAVIATISRETHSRNPDGTENPETKLQVGFAYSSGLGEVVMRKTQAEPGVAKQVLVNPDGSIAVDEVHTGSLSPQQLRWIGNGRTVKNNKGNAVKQYEPYFSVTHRYEGYKELVETGVTPLLYYDAIGRLTKTEMPDGSFSNVEFDSWKQTVYDANDTVLESEWYKERTDSAHPDFITDTKHQQAAAKAAAHAHTPNVLHFDTLGRPVLSIAHNKTSEGDEFYHTHSQVDTEGNLRSITDARGNTVVQYKYDMLGNRVYQHSMDAGQRWLLTNILGSPLRTWDERNHEFRYFYDVLQRPTHSKVLGGDAWLDHVFGRFIYGESLLLPDRGNEAALQEDNVLGQVIKVYDTGGLIATPAFDFKGQPLATIRKLFGKYNEVANWTNENLESYLEVDEFVFTTETDALGRVTRQTAPDGSIITSSYNEAGLLGGEKVQHPGDANPTAYIKDIDYNEKGQREKISYGNDVVTKFYYDNETFHLVQLQSKRKNGDPLQDLYYTYDAVGNITHIEDKNIPVVFFNNQKIEGTNEYTYDALYRLTQATGRENNVALDFTNDNWSDAAFMHNHSPGDAMAMRNYTQRYLYDAVGNMLQLKHVANGGNWTRNTQYEVGNNRIKNSAIGEHQFTYPHHATHGYITAMPHLEQLDWNFMEEVVRTIRQRRTDGGTPETVYYQYDGNGQRIRKITENQAAPGTTPTKKDERIYIGGYETYRTYTNNAVNFERNSLSLMDEDHCFVRIETVRQNNGGIGTPSTEEEAVGTRLVRYQLHNHLGSAALELDGTARVISYEEYHPFGTTAYQAKNAEIKAAAKRYRYTGMERDEETGLEYHSARYYLPWLGRWLSADPIGIEGGINLYEYALANPVGRSDNSGKKPARIGFIDESELPTTSDSEKPTLPTFTKERINLRGENFADDTLTYDEIVKSPNYVDNIVAENGKSLGARASNYGIWDLEIIELAYQTSKNIELRIPRAKINTDPTSPVRTFLSIDGIIYPADKDLNVVYDATNTPNIAYLASYIDNQKTIAAEQRLEFATIVFAFQMNFATLGAAAAGTGAKGGVYDFKTMIQPISKSQLRMPLGSLKIDQGGQFSESELRAAKYMKNKGYDVHLRKPRGTRSGGGTSDLLVNGKRYDVYTPTSSNPKNIIVNIVKKNDQATGIILDLSKTKVTPSQLGDLFKTVRDSGATNITNIFILP
ncbi:SpvB/TcaC N-terminal domain-containing protein [Parapedobacter defluvii]|uniref:SpvB/TcaC N-terminal domain-containing protein n=1 Tax=Parapedobacter defluvii TaxID=2045106 RepID=UPI00333EC419